MRILIAEDDPISSKVLQSTLKKWGYEVIATATGEEALAVMVQEDSPQLAILDWMMPGMDGPEVCEKYREQQGEAYKYIIMLTALEKKENVVTGLNAGADDYITKPFSAGELRARLNVGIRMIDLQNTLANHVKRLQEMDKVKTSFLSVVSHELRTPIAIMQEGISLCLEGVAGDITEMQRELLDDVLDNSGRLLRLITDLLDVSKIEAGKIKLNKSITNIQKTVQKTLKSFEPVASEKGVHLTTQLPEDPLDIYIDSDKFIQILNNLISNALRFTEKDGEVSITIEAQEDCIQCEVKDTGIGISKEDLPKLFNKFEQVGRVEGPGYKGTGLGLTIVKGLVEKHKGKVWVESEKNVGTSFFFTLRKEFKPSILIVDDEASIINVIKKILQDEKYFFYEALDGETAIHEAIEKIPSLIILDMKIPKMSGYEVLGRLKQDLRTMDIPIMIMSGYEIDEDRLGQVSNNSALPIVHKPFETETLRQKVIELVGV